MDGMGWIGYLLGPTLRAPYGANKDIDRDRRIGKVGMYFSIGALINNEFRGSDSGADEISTFSIKHAFNIHLTLWIFLQIFQHLIFIPTKKGKLLGVLHR